MKELKLNPFLPNSWPLTLSVGWELNKSILKARFQLQGELKKLKLPSHSPSPQLVDGLYHHSCFEIFAALDSRYIEWNFSPSGDWAVFNFDKYRKRSPETTPSNIAPEFSITRPRIDCLEMNCTLEARAFTHLKGEPKLIAFTSVLETQEGSLSYWAIKHEAEKPDFHSRVGFIET